MWIGEFNVVNILSFKCVPRAVADSARVLIRESLEILIRGRCASDSPHLVGIGGDHALVEFSYVLDDSVYLGDVQLEVFETDWVQLVCR